MTFLARACSILLASAVLISAQSPNVVVEISPVVHAATPFSAVLRLPASLALKKGSVEAQVCLVDGQGEETHLVKRKLAVSAGGKVFLEHELEGLLVGCVDSNLTAGV